MQYSLGNKAKPTEKYDGSSYIGDTFVDFSLDDVNGKIWQLDGIHSSIKVIVLFRLDSCPPCLHEYILWNKIYKTFKPNEVFILGIANSSDISGVHSFMIERDIHFPILLDPRDFIKQTMGLKLSILRITLNDENKIIDVSVPNSQYKMHENYLKNIAIWLNQKNILGEKSRR